MRRVPLVRRLYPVSCSGARGARRQVAPPEVLGPKGHVAPQDLHPAPVAQRSGVLIVEALHRLNLLLVGPDWGVPDPAPYAKEVRQRLPRDVLTRHSCHDGEEAEETAHRRPEGPVIWRRIDDFVVNSLVGHQPQAIILQPYPSAPPRSLPGRHLKRAFVGPAERHRVGKSPPTKSRLHTCLHFVEARESRPLACS